MTEQRCHYCHRVRDCRTSPTGHPTCGDCWPRLRCCDTLGYVRCADCQSRSDSRIDAEYAPGVLGLGVNPEDRCDVCGKEPA